MTARRLLCFGGLSIALGLSQARAEEEEVALYELLRPEGAAEPAIPMHGDVEAPVVVIEVRSFSCTHCQHFHENAYPEIVKRYIDTGKVRWGVLDVEERLRLDDPKLFELARCLQAQGLYWQNQDFFFEFEYQPSSFLAMDAEFLEGVDVKKLRQCFAKGEMRGEVDFVYAAMQKKRIKALPTFFLCVKKEDGSWLEKRVEGAIRFSDFEREYVSLVGDEP